MSSDKLDAHQDAYRESFPHHDENMYMLEGYVRRMLDGLAGRTSLRVLSLGIGHRIVSRGLVEGLGDRLDEYVIVEGSREIIDGYVTDFQVEPKMRIEHALFESYTPSSTEPFDVIEMGFVLEHVDDPAVVLSRYREYLEPEGVLFVSVPNARSLHRVVGHAAGLLDDVYRLSSADHALGHKRYFDLQTITQLVNDAGFRASRVEGILVKPLTTAQLGQLSLSPEVHRAFDAVATSLPALSNAIFIEAKARCSS